MRSSPTQSLGASCIVVTYTAAERAMRGTAPLSFATSEPCTEAEGQVGFLLQQIWFAALVGWMGGVQDEETIVEHMASAADILKPGTDMVCAGYCMYSSSTVLVLTLGDGVNGFTLAPQLGAHVGALLLAHDVLEVAEGLGVGLLVVRLLLLALTFES